jgi:hypothetical protein
MVAHQIMYWDSGSFTQNNLNVHNYSNILLLYFNVQAYKLLKNIISIAPP